MRIVAGLLAMAAMLAGIVAMAYFLIPATRLLQTSTSQHACGVNLKRIGLAMRAYQRDHGTFPPAVVLSPDGKPMHSWRVLLLPYLGHDDLYRLYRFDERWDGPNNLYLAAQMPGVFACPDDLNTAEQTSYLVINGSGLIFNGPQTTSPSQITDGLRDTILVVEAPSSGVNWLEPRDLTASAMTFHVNSGKSGEIGCHHAGGGANVLMASGDVRNLPNTLSPATVEALLTIDQADGPGP